MENAICLQRRTHWARPVVVLVMTLTLILSACGAQQPPKVYRIGVLSGLDFIAGITDGFKAGMADLGYIEGQNISYDVRATNFDMEAYRSILKEFVANDVDLILVFPTEASIEAKIITAGTDIPVVFSFALIEGMNLVDSVREPGGNLTGVRYPGPDIAVKRYDVMRELAPSVSRILVPYQAGYPIVDPQLEAIRSAANEDGVTLIELPAADAADLETALAAHVVDGTADVDAVLLLAEPLGVTAEPFVALAKFAAAHNMPIGGAYMVVNGYEALFGINVDVTATGRQAAPLADKILKGTPAGTIPVASADTFLQLSYREAQRLGLDVPEGLLSQANEIIR